MTGYNVFMIDLHVAFIILSLYEESSYVLSHCGTPNNWFLSLPI